MRGFTIRLLTCATAALVLGCSGPSDGPPKTEDASPQSKKSVGENGSTTSDASLVTGTIKSHLWARKAGVSEGQKEAITDRVILQSGTEIGWEIELDQPARVYILYRGPSGQVEILYPGEDGQQVSRKGHQPVFAEATELDDEVGIERYYLIASLNPVEPLESRIAQLREAPEEDRERFVKPLLDALLDVRTKYEDVERTAGRPARIGASVRGGDSDNGALEYDIHQVFCRTFTIDHR